MKLKRKAQTDEPIKDGHLKVNLVDVDPREDPVEDSMAHIEDVKTVQIGAQSLQTTKIRFNLSSKEEADITGILRENIYMFAWKPTDIPIIDPNVVCHHLALDSTIKPIL